VRAFATIPKRSTGDGDDWGRAILTKPLFNDDVIHKSFGTNDTLLALELLVLELVLVLEPVLEMLNVGID